MFKFLENKLYIQDCKFATQITDYFRDQIIQPYGCNE